MQDLDKAKKLFKNKTLNLSIDLGMGSHSELLWGCDLGQEYIKINSSYLT